MTAADTAAVLVVAMAAEVVGNSSTLIAQCKRRPLHGAAASRYPHARHPNTLIRAHNRGMKLGAFVGWGVVIYAVMQLIESGLVTYGFFGGFLPRVIEFAALLALCVIAGRALRFSSWKDIMPYSLSWAAISALLDAIYLTPSFGWHIYSSGGLWLGYVLIVLLPLLAPYTRRASHDVPRIT